MATNPVQSALAQKAEASNPSAAAPAAQEQQAAPEQNPTAAPEQPTPDTDKDSSDESSAAPVSLHRAFSNLQEKLTALMDVHGKRSATIPYIHGGSSEDHISAVGQALQSVGGVTRNVLTSAHHANGRGFGSGDGATVAFHADTLRDAVIPANSELAKAALSAESNLINQIAKLIGDKDQSVQVARSQIKLVGKSSGAGMTLLDFVSALQAIPGPAVAAVARAHSGTKEGGHAPHLRAPKP